MKTTLTILLTLFTVTVWGQHKDGDTVWFRPTDIYNNKPVYDTTKCWLKELEVRQCRCLGIGDTIIEHWQQGFQVTERVSPIQIESAFYRGGTISKPVCYLYSDRKTKVTNQVIYSIAR